MPCTSESYEAMAEAGWSEEELQLLRNEIELARREAEAKAYAEGATLKAQRKAMDKAEANVRAVAHDREHRRQADAMKEINVMTEFKRQNPNTHYDETAREVGLGIVNEATAGAGHRHLGR